MKLKYKQFMVKRILFLLFLSVFTNVLCARELHGSYISVGGHYGSVLASNEFFEGDNAISGYTTQTLKYTMWLSDDMWQKEAYGDPYYGVGIALNQFGRSDDLGDPFAIYLIQGATFTHIARRLALNYELNLGVITGWEQYNSVSNPGNVAMGSKTSVHLALDIYFKYYISNRFDLHVGGSLFHSSNGSSQHPNKGINAANIYAEIAYNFNRDLDKVLSSSQLQVPDFTPHYEHDVELIVTSRNSKDIGPDKSVSDNYNTEMFPIFGVAYKFMRVPNYKYRYGVGVEVLYDESSCAEMSREYSTQSDSWVDNVSLAPLKKRMSVGASINGEMVKPYYSVFANIGYTLYQPNEVGASLYQTVGVKADLYENIFGSFGVRAESFNKAIFLYWSLGYTFGS